MDTFIFMYQINKLRYNALKQSGGVNDKLRTDPEARQTPIYILFIRHTDSIKQLKPRDYAVNVSATEKYHEKILKFMKLIDPSIISSDGSISRVCGQYTCSDTVHNLCTGYTYGPSITESMSPVSIYWCYFRDRSNFLKAIQYLEILSPDRDDIVSDYPEITMRNRHDDRLSVDKLNLKNVEVQEVCTFYDKHSTIWYHAKVIDELMKKRRSHDCVSILDPAQAA
jgi:hypothetical protein